MLRLLLAFVAGFAIGWERESHGRPAGLRTTILTCVGAAVTMMLSQIIFSKSAASIGSNSWHPDPARLGSGILAGIGFLGAGTILRHENVIRGVTTAATLWFVTIMGLTLGLGEFALGLCGAAVALATLFFLPQLEKFIPSDFYAILTVTGALESFEEDDLRQRIQTFGPIVKNMRLRYDLEKKQKTATCELKLKKNEAFKLASDLVAALARFPGVVEVNWV